MSQINRRVNLPRFCFVLSSGQYLLQITKHSDQEPAPRFDILVQLQPSEGLGAWRGGSPGPPPCPAVNFQAVLREELAERVCECDSTSCKAPGLFLCRCFLFPFPPVLFYCGLNQCLICLFSLRASNNSSLSSHCFA